MSHTVHPYAHRLGIIRDWKSRWFSVGGGKSAKYRQQLKTDVLIREYLDTRLRNFYVEDIQMERGEGKLRIIIKSSRPGMIIGRSGEGSAKLRNDIVKKMGKIGAEMPRDLKIDIEEVRSPESHAGIMSAMICEQLEKKMPFRRVIKQSIEKIMANKEVKGAKITVAGRLGGAEMARRESVKKGRLPLQTLRADIDYSYRTAYLNPEGNVGVKVWVYKGDIFEDKKANK